MKKMFKTLSLLMILSFSANSSQAGVGLSLSAVGAFLQGEFLGAAIGGSLGAVAIVKGGIPRLNGTHKKGKRVGWGVFWLVLEENESNTFNAEDHKILVDADIAVKESLYEIYHSDDLSVEEKEELIKELI